MADTQINCDRLMSRDQTFEEADTNSDGNLDFDEFVKYKNLMKEKMAAKLDCTFPEIPMDLL